MTKSEFRNNFQFLIPNSQFWSLGIIFYFVILVWLLVILSLPISAQEKDLIINADNVSFDKERNLVEATGSVEVIYKDVTVNGNHIVYNTSTETVRAEKGFVLDYEGITMEGDWLDYQIKSKKGKASKFMFIYRGLRMGGGEIDFGMEEFRLNDATFTTCDLEWPHYHVTAREIILDPKYGWLVAYWGFFWLGRIPLIPVPTYIYDVSAEERGEKNLPPFPEISSNDEDGVFINERLAWHIRREFSGTYSINYATKKGFGGGADANYILNETSRGDIRLYGNGTDGLWGGVTHRLFFGGEVGEEAEIPFVFFARPRYYRYELETNLSHRERINYQRVSLYPEIAFRSRRGEILRKEIRYDAELSAAKVAEEDNIDLARGRGDFTLYGDFPETALGKITPSLSLDARFYSDGGKWTKTMGGLQIRKNFAKNLSLGLGYLHYFSVEGISPFAFEMYRFNSVDRLTSDLFFLLGETGAGVFASYFTDTWQAEDIDYSLFFRLHCYNLIIKYRSLRREFEMGFSLVGG